MSDEPRQAGAGVEARAASQAEPVAREAAELVARLRHEINNPLTGLIGQAQLLLRDQSLSDEARRRVETMEQLAKRIRDTVASLRVAEEAAEPHATKPGAKAEAEASTAADPPRH